MLLYLAFQNPHKLKLLGLNLEKGVTDGPEREWRMLYIYACHLGRKDSDFLVTTI